MKLKLTAKTVLLITISMLLFSCTDDSVEPDPSPSDARTKFLGSWSVNETWTKLTYVVNITADPNSTDGVIISNFANSGTTGTPAKAHISGNSISLDPDQMIGDGWIINGGGTFSGTTTINWQYTINDGATLINAIATYTRR